MARVGEGLILLTRSDNCSSLIGDPCSLGFGFKHIDTGDKGAIISLCTVRICGIRIIIGIKSLNAAL